MASNTSDTKDVQSSEERRETIGWLRAIASGVVIAAAGVLGVVVLPNIVLTSGSSLSRDTRMVIASVVSIASVCVLAWAVARAQRRGTI